MAICTVYSAIKGVDSDRARSAIEEALTVLPGKAPQHSRWDDYQHTVRMQPMVGVVSNGVLCLADNAWMLAFEIARRLNAVHMELRVQEGDHWDFSLYRAGTLLADFSTRVGAFHEDPEVPRPWKAGDIHAFADAWDISVDRIAPYLIDWDAQSQPSWAMQGDKYPTGDWCQILDFMQTIGVIPPHGHPDRFEFEVPRWTGVYQRQPRWRRIVRRFSVWCRGVYPDVPRRTTADRARYRRKQARVRIIRSYPKDILDRNS